MNKCTRIIPLVLLAAVPYAWADEDYDENEDDLTYSSFRVTQADPGFDNVDPGFNLGYTLGFRLPMVEMLAIEFDISSTVIPGENSGGVSPPLLGGNDGGGNDDGGLLDPILGGGGGDNGGGGQSSSRSGNFTRVNDDFLVNTLGIYARAQTPKSWHKRFFGSVRVGYSYIDTTIPELVEDENSHASWGLGLGYRYGKRGLLELRYTQVSSDLRYLGLGITY